MQKILSEKILVKEDTMLRNKLRLIISLLILFATTVFCFTAANVTRAEELNGVVYLNYESQWNYHAGYIDGFESAGVSEDFSLDGFSEGKAPFGFSIYDGVYDLGTTLQNNETYYIFTKEFDVQNSGIATKFSVYYDDAVAIYINGKEVYRDNITGFDFERVANGDSVITTVGKAKETVFYTASDFIKDGKNTVTAIIVEDYKAGSDAYFDLKIEGVEKFDVSADGAPDTIALTYYDDPYTSRGVTFYTSKELFIADARIRKVGESEYRYFRSNGEIWYGRVCHKITFSDLEENCEYEYSLGLKDFGFWGNTFKFKTESKSDTNENFKFGFITDTQSSDNWQFSIWDGLASLIEEYGDNFNFMIHGGDIVESSTTVTGLRPEQWRDGFNLLQRYLATVPTVPVTGNHEYAAYAFVKHFNIKYRNFNDTGAYYSFDYGNAHFTVLNTNDLYFDQYRGKENALMPEQYEWLKNDLKSTDKPWKIVCMHFPAVSWATYEYDRIVRENLMPIFAENKVDLVLQGHTHIYFRSAIYAHADDIKGEDRAETYSNIRNSVIAESDLNTYVDAIDGTFWTVNPNGVEYITVKSTNYNVYYQNLTYSQADEECVFAVNPINGEIMNGGEKDGADVGYLMNYYQYASVEVQKDSLKCNVYIIDTRTGERQLFDQYCVIKTDADKFGSLVESIPSVDKITMEDFETLLRVYGLYSVVGSDYLTEEQAKKVQDSISYINTESIEKLKSFVKDLENLGENDLSEFLRLKAIYDLLSATEKSFVDASKLDVVADSFEIKEVIAEINSLTKLETLKLSQIDVENLINKYEGLTARQKAGVTNFAQIKELTYKLKAKAVMQKIDLLKVAPYKEQVEEVFAEYSALSPEEKVYVENVGVLNSAKSLTTDTETGASCGAGIDGGSVAIICTCIVLFVILIRRRKI